MNSPQRYRLVFRPPSSFKSALAEWLVERRADSKSQPCLG